MTYKTRQEVLRAAADWMDVCAAAGIKARFKFDKKIEDIDDFKPSYDDKNLRRYEFPLALLEGKEVWVGSELYTCAGNKVTVTAEYPKMNFTSLGCSWSPPKPKTVLVELTVDDAEYFATAYDTEEKIKTRIERVAEAFSKALDKL